MKSKIIRNTEGNVLMGGRQNIKLAAVDTSSAISVTFSMVPAGSGIPLHEHSREDEIFMLTDGELEVTLDGGKHILKKGDMVFLPKNIPHGFKAIQETGMWVTLVPGGAENMFLELATLPPGPPDMEKVKAICEGYGIKFI